MLIHLVLDYGMNLTSLMKRACLKLNNNVFNSKSRMEMYNFRYKYDISDVYLLTTPNTVW